MKINAFPLNYLKFVYNYTVLNQILKPQRVKLFTTLTFNKLCRISDIEIEQVNLLCLSEL